MKKLLLTCHCGQNSGLGFGIGGGGVALVLLLVLPLTTTENQNDNNPGLITSVILTTVIQHLLCNGVALSTLHALPHLFLKRMQDIGTIITPTL